MALLQFQPPLLAIPQCDAAQGALEEYAARSIKTVDADGNKPKLLNGRNGAEGQVRGVTWMVVNDRYCIEILAQAQAVRAALQQVEA